MTNSIYLLPLLWPAEYSWVELHVNMLYILVTGERFSRGTDSIDIFEIGVDSTVHGYSMNLLSGVVDKFRLIRRGGAGTCIVNGLILSLSEVQCLCKK